MKGIFPWETLPHNYFAESISWEFSCLDRAADDPAKLEEFWLPDQHELKIRVIIKFGTWDDKMRRVLSAGAAPKWILSWSSAGTSLCASSDPVCHHDEYIDILCTIPPGSCAKNLILEPVAISTGGQPDKDGLFSPPPGAVLTLITPLVITFGEAPAFPLYEKYGDGSTLLTWSMPDDLAENLHEDMARLIVVEADMNHAFLKTCPGEIEQAGRQKKGLLYHMIICDYLRIICADEQLIQTAEDVTFLPGTAGYSVRWLLTEIAANCNFPGIAELAHFLRKNPAQISKTVDRVFSSVLTK